MTIKLVAPEIELLDKNQELVTIASDITDYKWGKSPLKRTIDELIKYGVINLDKPANPTSHEVVSYIKKIFDIAKAGHSGTLDPAVTGVLPTALQEATKILNTLLLSGKEYVCNMTLHANVEEDTVRKVIGEYKGEIFQRPPLRASVKRVLRKRTIYQLDILEIKERDVLFLVKCQAGTYIRKLTHDIGQSLGCGAHMKELRRTKTGPFSEEQYLVTLQEVFDAYQWYLNEKDEIPLRNVILPMEYAVKHLEKLFVKDNAVDSICHGAPVALPAIVKYTTMFQEGDIVAIYTLKKELIALGESQIAAKRIQNDEKGVIVKIKRVVMERGTYKTEKRKELS